MFGDKSNILCIEKTTASKIQYFSLKKDSECQPFMKTQNVFLELDPKTIIFHILNSTENLIFLLKKGFQVSSSEDFRCRVSHIRSTHEILFFWLEILNKLRGFQMSSGYIAVTKGFRYSSSTLEILLFSGKLDISWSF